MVPVFKDWNHLTYQLFMKFLGNQTGFIWHSRKLSSTWFGINPNFRTCMGALKVSHRTRSRCSDTSAKYCLHQRSVVMVPKMRCVLLSILSQLKMKNSSVIGNEERFVTGDHVSIGAPVFDLFFSCNEGVINKTQHLVVDSACLRVWVQIYDSNPSKLGSGLFGHIRFCKKALRWSCHSLEALNSHVGRDFPKIHLDFPIIYMKLTTLTCQNVPFPIPVPERGVSLAFSLPSWFFADPRKQAESSCRLFSSQGLQGNCSLEVFWMVDWGIPRLDLCLKRENPPKKCTKSDFFSLYAGWFPFHPHLVAKRLICSSQSAQLIERKYQKGHAWLQGAPTSHKWSYNHCK